LGAWFRVSRGHYVTVEGTVEDFIAGDSGDHRPETWSVRDSKGLHRYSYSPSRGFVGFTQTQAHGGPMRSGLRVRVADVDGLIARLEIAP
jgi:hypothetical protein